MATDILERTAQFVKERLSGESSGHDWWHIWRVRRLALRIAAEEGGNLVVIELAALLHDIADHKFHNGDTKIGPRVAREWLESQDVAEHIILQVCEIIGTISFKGVKVPNAVKTLEGKVVQDADRLDGIGAIGIARAFAYGGHTGRILHDPAIQPVMHESFEAYRTSKAPTLNQFYERMVFHLELLNTATAKQLAQRRHEFMMQFLDEFHAEWDGDV